MQKNVNTKCKNEQITKKQAKIISKHTPAIEHAIRNSKFKKAKANFNENLASTCITGSVKLVLLSITYI